jgi:desulfoferrodoxin (superoxide reductase-like protein)
MNPEKPHYIMYIKLKDGEGNLLGEKEFQATDEKAEAVFELKTVPSKLVAYEKCNLHGLWMDGIDVTTE